MKFLKVAVGLAGVSAIIAVTAHGQIDPSPSSNEPKREAIADSGGNLHVPHGYRTTYQLLGSWAVANNQGHGSKELHVVYASPETIAAYRSDGRFPDGAVLVKEVFQAATGQMTTGTVSRAETLKGWFVMLKDSNGRYARNKLWATAGAGHGSTLTTRRRQLRPITRRIVGRVMCQRKPPIGFTSTATRR